MAKARIASVRLDEEMEARVSIRMEALGCEDRSDYLRVLIERDTQAVPVVVSVGVDRSDFSLQMDGREIPPEPAVEGPCPHPVDQRKSLAFGTFCFAPGCGLKLA